MYGTIIINKSDVSKEKEGMDIWSICWSETVDNEIRDYWERYTDEEKAKARTIELMKNEAVDVNTIFIYPPAPVLSPHAFVGDRMIYYQPQFNIERWKAKGFKRHMFYLSRERAEMNFPGHPIEEFKGADVKDPIFVA